MIKKILLPVDGSEFCKRSYKLAIEIARKYSAVITILHVRHKFMQRDGIEEMIKEAKVSKINDVFKNKDAVKILKKARAYFSIHGVSAETKLVEGDPAQTIIDFAQKGSYDAIIMCTHGMGGFKRFTMGSVTHRVVVHSSVPVLVVQYKTVKVIDIQKEREKRFEDEKIK